jgi:CrcB protein
VLGGFTTFSAFSLDMLYFLREGRVALAALYAGVMLMLGLLAVYFGFRSAALF